MQLTQRQGQILKAVVEEHHESGRPVGSRTLVERRRVEASASTVRYELGRLDAMGMLEAPHTSAGRVPTDLGYRTYVDHLMDTGDGAVARRASDAISVPHGGDDALTTRIDEALLSTTRQLAEMTGLLAVITAPRASGAVIRHIEVLQLQPTVLMIVVITASGQVAQHQVQTGAPVDAGLVDWAGEYLNEQVAGLSIGQSLLRQRLAHPELHPAERAMLALLSPAFSELVDEGQELHVGASPEVIADLGVEVQRVMQLVALLDERRRLLEALRPITDRAALALHTGISAGSVSVRIGGENAMPELHRLTVVGAPYGVGGRPLGMVGLIGPRAMDYTLAMRTVHLAAGGLSARSEELYGG